MVSIATFLFHKLVVAHIATGTMGLITMWVPVVGRKGGATHRKWGTIFAWALIATGVIAVGISLCTLIAPLETHPHNGPPFTDNAPLIRGIFGWMMLYLATMTIALAWYGLQCIRLRSEHKRHRNALEVTLQCLMFMTAANCMFQGVLLGQPLLMGIAVVGLTAGVLNLKFIFTDSPPLFEWQIQHSRGLVGAGISVYTAFLAFGAVNLLPSYALNPALWATPAALGISYLLYHQFRIARRRPSARPHAA
ncbi:MAG: hypothetical protein AAFU66_03825 [Pseudomonadota bacterium]